MKLSTIRNCKKIGLRCSYYRREARVLLLALLIVAGATCVRASQPAAPVRLPANWIWPSPKVIPPHDTALPDRVPNRLPIQDCAVAGTDCHGMHDFLLTGMFCRFFFIDFNSETRLFSFQPVPIASFEGMLHNVPSPGNV